MPPAIPIKHYLISKKNQQNREKVVDYYSMLMYSCLLTCLKHSNFLKVNALDAPPHIEMQQRSPRKCPSQTRFSPKERTSRLQQKSNYELFNHNNFNIRYWSWNYRGCWHQTCPPIDTHRKVYKQLIPDTRHVCPVLLFLVTTSLCQDWVICAPAAFLRCGSRFSGSLSGIKP